MPTSLSELQGLSGGDTVRVAVIKATSEVQWVGEVASRVRGGATLIDNQSAILAAFPGCQLLIIGAEEEVAPGYTRERGGFAAPVKNKMLAWEFFALFAPDEQGRYFAALDAGNVGVRSLSEMLKLQAGTLVEGDHPVIQYGLYVLRQAGIIATDERLTELGNLVQGIVPGAPV